MVRDNGAHFLAATLHRCVGQIFLHIVDLNLAIVYWNLSLKVAPADVNSNITGGAAGRVLQLVIYSIFDMQSAAVMVWHLRFAHRISIKFIFRGQLERYLAGCITISTEYNLLVHEFCGYLRWPSRRSPLVDGLTALAYLFLIATWANVRRNAKRLLRHHDMP